MSDIPVLQKPPTLFRLSREVYVARRNQYCYPGNLFSSVENQFRPDHQLTLFMFDTKLRSAGYSTVASDRFTVREIWSGYNDVVNSLYFHQYLQLLRETRKLAIGKSAVRLYRKHCHERVAFSGVPVEFLPEDMWQERFNKANKYAKKSMLALRNKEV